MKWLDVKILRFYFNARCKYNISACFRVTMGTGGKSRPGRDAADHPPSSAEVENE
jgi:hypothetical protein